MIRFSANPTRTQILEENWYEFLQYTKSHPLQIGSDTFDKFFWIWYIQNRLEDPNEPTPKTS